MRPKPRLFLGLFLGMLGPPTAIARNIRGITQSKPVQHCLDLSLDEVPSDLGVYRRSGGQSEVEMPPVSKIQTYCCPPL